jgi:hypothetical protein
MSQSYGTGDLSHCCAVWYTDINTWEEPGTFNWKVEQSANSVFRAETGSSEMLVRTQYNARLLYPEDGGI